MTYFPHIRQCSNPACGFRFPVTEFDKNFEICPKCKSQTIFICEVPQFVREKNNIRPEARISLILDNLRSVFNVGSIFRSADGCGVVVRLYLCGTTPTPDHPKMAKTALGAENSVPWSYHLNGLKLANKLVSKGKKLIALEMTPDSQPIKTFLSSMEPGENLVFVVGNEVVGVDPEILALASEHTHLPMHGIKESLNVAIAASIFCYSI